MNYGLYALIGAVIGGGLVWLIYDIKAKAIIADLQKRLGAAEAENLRIPPLEQQIAETKAENAELQERIAELKADVAQKAETITVLNAQLIEQANAAKNKLTMLNDVQGRFCQAMATLSETALNCDNEEFIRVMEVNVTAFERTLLEDIGKWQSRDQAATQEVCELADSEQTETPLFAQDQAMEGLVAVDEPTVGDEFPAEAEGVEAAEAVEQDNEEPVVIDEALSGEEETAVDVSQELRIADEAFDVGPDAEDLRVVEEEPALVQDEKAEEDRIEVNATDEAETVEDNGGIDAALIESRTADAVADLERELEEELANSADDADLELDFGEDRAADGAIAESSDADDTGEIRLVDDDESEAAPALKFPIAEVPASHTDGAADAVAAVESAGKKKLNSESGSLGARKEAV